MLRIRNPQDLVAGLVFLGFGAAGLWIARGYAMGTAARMGPGYLPSILAAGLILFGLVIVARALAVDGPAIERIGLRPVLVILAAVVLFGLLIDRFGLAPAVAASTLAMGVAAESRHWREVILVSLAMAVFCVAVFVLLLGQPMKIWAW